jgi:hypothetical protein
MIFEDINLLITLQIIPLALTIMMNNYTEIMNACGENSQAMLLALNKMYEVYL